MNFSGYLRFLGVITVALVGFQCLPHAGTRAEAAERFVVLGPIPGHDGTGIPDLEEFRKASFEADLLAEAGGEASIKVSEDVVVNIAGKTFKWTPAMVSDVVVDLEKTLGRHEWSAAYAYTEVDSDEAKEIILGLGSDDSVRVWLNGELVHSKWAGRPLIVDQDLFPVKVRKGKNRLLVKVVNWTLGSAFSCRPVPEQVLTSTLSRAVFRGDHESLGMLLGHNVSPNKKTALGIKPIQISKIYGDKVMTKMLLDAGAEDLSPPEDPSVVTQAIFNAAAFDNLPGLCVLVARDGKIVFQGALGLADVESARQVDANSKFRIGSVTKQFTAAAILKLVEEGKISVDDRLDKFLPDFPRGADVTIHQLLTHTSGIPSYTDDPSFYSTVTEPTTEEELIATFAGKDFVFEPGTDFRYNNSGYFLLGHIVRKVSGKDLGEYLQESFFEPLGMNDTGMHSAAVALENEAIGYSVQGDSVTLAINWAMSRAGGAGALYSTVGDLMKWNEALFSGKVLKEETLRKAFTAVKESGVGMRYGYGWMIGQQRGLSVISHAGGLNGFQSNLVRFPEQNVTIVALHNASPAVSDLTPVSITAQLADLFLWKEMEPREVLEVNPNVSPEVYERYVGRYDYGGAIMAVTREGNQLFAQLTGQPRFEIFPATETKFFWKAVKANVEFLLDEDGKCVAVHHVQGPSDFEAAKLPEHPGRHLTMAQLDEFLGVYDYKQAKMKVTRQGSQLVAQLEGQPAFPIFPTENDLFVWKVVEAQIKFVRDDEGRVIGAIHSQGGSDLKVDKVE
jgi:CubicO group peptidase (beta-lactamase class C family)